MTSQFEYGTVSKPEDAQQLGVILNATVNYQRLADLLPASAETSALFAKQEQIIAAWLYT